MANKKRDRAVRLLKDVPPGGKFTLDRGRSGPLMATDRSMSGSNNVEYDPEAHTHKRVCVHLKGGQLFAVQSDTQVRLGGAS